MRPVLQSEPTAFNKIVNILKRRVFDERVRASFDRQKAIFSGEEIPAADEDAASAASATESVLNSEATFQLSPGACEYHRNENWKAAIEELHALLPFVRM